MPYNCAAKSRRQDTGACGIQGQYQKAIVYWELSWFFIQAISRSRMTAMKPYLLISRTLNDSDAIKLAVGFSLAFKQARGSRRSAQKPTCRHHSLLGFTSCLYSEQIQNFRFPFLNTTLPTKRGFGVVTSVFEIHWQTSCLLSISQKVLGSARLPLPATAASPQMAMSGGFSPIVSVLRLTCALLVCCKPRSLYSAAKATRLYVRFSSELR